MNYHQSIDEILKTATPEQKIIWEYIFNRYGEKCSIQRFFIRGNIANNLEITTYALGKMFFIYKGAFTGASAVPAAIAGYALIYDEGNNLQYMVSNNSFYWDATAAAYRAANNYVEYTNMLFSRYNYSVYEYGYMIGYKLIFG